MRAREVPRLKMSPSTDPVSARRPLKSRSTGWAQLIARLVRRLLAGGVRGREIAVISPFRQQVQALGAALAGLPQPVRLGTVETVQGQSVEVALVSLASSDPAYLSQIADFYFWPNRWNVAFSRARTKLVVVGSGVVVEAFPPAMLVGTQANDLTNGLNRIAQYSSPDV